MEESIVVVEDCVVCAGGSNTTPEELRKSMITYLTIRIVFSVNSKEILYKDTKTYECF